MLGKVPNPWQIEGVWIIRMRAGSGRVAQPVWHGVCGDMLSGAETSDGHACGAAGQERQELGIEA
jgi:hypothetical protein